MKKILFSILFVFILILAAFLCEKCNNGSSEYSLSAKSGEYDFGQGYYREPFVGILESRPFLLVESLKIPPYKWCVDDTVVLDRKFVINYNEESLRDTSSICIGFDASKMPVSFYDRNGKNVTNVGVKSHAFKSVDSFVIYCRVSPNVGDNQIRGNIFAKSFNMDEVNDKRIQGHIVFGSWLAKQEIGKPYMLWTLWGLTALLLLLLLLLLLWGIYRFLSRRKKGEKDATKAIASVVPSSVTPTDQKELIKYSLHPWIGKKYLDGLDGFRTLVVGASTYCKNQNCDNYSNCMKGLCSQGYKCPENGELLEESVSTELKIFFDSDKGYTTYRKFSDLFRTRFAESNDIDDRVIWSRVAFYEFVQTILPSYETPQYQGASIASFDCDYEKFEKIVAQLLPHLVIVWGKPVSEAIVSNICRRNSELIQCGDGVAVCNDIVFCFITHPSSPQWNQDEVYDVISRGYDILVQTRNASSTGI